MAAATAFKTGIGSALYRNTATYGTPTWTVQSLIQSVTLNSPWDFVDANSRASAAKLYGKSLVDIGVQVTYRSDDLDTSYLVWLAAHWSRTTVLDLLILNGLIATEGVQGVRGEFLVSMSGEPQDIGGSIITTFDLKPTYTTNGYPKSVLMGASSTPSFSAISV
jgi:hypothetical protein